MLESQHPAYGYEIENGEIVINKEKTLIIEMIFKQYLKGISIAQIPTQTGLAQNHIRSIISNEVYLIL